MEPPDAHPISSPTISPSPTSSSTLSPRRSWPLARAGHARLEQTWYVRSEETEEVIEHKLTRLLDSEDGLLIQRVKDDAFLTNTSVRWFKQRQGGVEAGGDTNIIGLPGAEARADGRAGIALRRSLLRFFLRVPPARVLPPS